MQLHFSQLGRLRVKELMVLNSDAGENSIESPLDSKEMKRVNPKGNQS